MRRRKLRRRHGGEMSGGGRNTFDFLVAKFDQGVLDMKRQMLEAESKDAGKERNELMKKVGEGSGLMDGVLLQMRDDIKYSREAARRGGAGVGDPGAMQSLYKKKEEELSEIAVEFEQLQEKMLEDDTSEDRRDNVSETREEGGIMINIETQFGKGLKIFDLNLFADSVDDIKEHIVKKKGYDIENVNLKLLPKGGISIDGPLMNAGLDVQTLPGGKQVVKLYLHLNNSPSNTLSANLGNLFVRGWPFSCEPSVQYVVVITNLKADKNDNNIIQRPTGNHWLLFTTKPEDVDKLKAEIHTEIEDKFKNPDFKGGELLFAGEKLTQDKFDAVEFGNLPPIFNYNFIDSPLGKVGVPFYDFAIMGLSAAFIAALIMSLFGVALSYRIL